MNVFHTFSLIKSIYFIYHFQSAPLYLMESPILDLIMEIIRFQLKNIRFSIEKSFVKSNFPAILVFQRSFPFLDNIVEIVSFNAYFTSMTLN